MDGNKRILRHPQEEGFKDGEASRQGRHDFTDSALRIRMNTKLFKGERMAKNDAFEPKEVFSGLIEDEGISRRSLIKGASAVTAAAVLPTLISPSLARAQAPADPG